MDLCYFIFQIQTLIAHEYRDKFTGPDKLFKALDQMAADSDMVCQTEEFAQIMAKNGNQVYRYFYNHQSSKGETKCFIREIDSNFMDCNFFS